MNSATQTIRAVSSPELIATAKTVGVIVPPTSWGLTLPTSGKIVAFWFDARGRKQCGYSQEAVTQRNTRKFAEMQNFGAALLNIRAAYRADLHSSNTRTRACAAVVMLMDVTTMRVGGAEYAEENGTYGASSLLKAHTGVLCAQRSARNSVSPDQRRLLR